VFGRWGSFVYRRRLVVIVGVVLLTVLGGVVGLGVFDRLSDGQDVAPGSESAAAKQLTERAAGSQGDVTVVYSAPAGSTVDDPEFARGVNETLDRLPRSHVEQVTSYFTTKSPAMATPDKRDALATVKLTGAGGDKVDAFDAIKHDLSPPGVHTEIGGQVAIQQAITDQARGDLEMAEAISIPVTLVLLAVIFGSIAAAMLPVLVGGLAILGSLGILDLVSLGLDLNSFAVNVVSLLGLGLAIDYGLFTVSRFREELATGREVAAAVRRTVATAGRTVAFSGTLLVTALAALTIFPLDTLRSIAIGGVAAVAVAALVSLSVLPALLGVLGHRVDSLALPWLKRRKEAGESTAGGNPAFWRRLADRVMRRPVFVAVPIVTVLVLLGAPLLNVQLGGADQTQLPPDNKTRQAIESVLEKFPAGGNGSAQIVLRGTGDTPPGQQAIGQFAADADKVSGVAPSGREGDAVLLSAKLPGNPMGEQAKQAVSALRGIAEPAGTDVLVGGYTAQVMDVANTVTGLLPVMIGIVVLATLVLMFLAFGSVVLPVKAVLASALSLCATYGVLVWMFQDGHGADLLNVTPQPAQPLLLVLIGAVVFGLSTDYEVFLLSRMVEEYRSGADTRGAVRTGLAGTGRVISAAALLLIVVTGAFALSGIVSMRFVGVGMIIALLVDATVVRMLLVPALLRLLGSAAWWAPGALRRLAQRSDVHGSPEPDHGEAELAGRR
jgi:RND superfamily putative drug exporter